MIEMSNMHLQIIELYKSLKMIHYGRLNICFIVYIGISYIPICKNFETLIRNGHLRIYLMRMREVISVYFVWKLLRRFSFSM